MADSPRKRYVRSPSPWEENSRSRSRSRSKSRSWSRPRERSRSRSRSRGRGTGREEVVNDGTTLYVTGLSTRVTEKELEDHFSKEGKVKSVFLVVEPRSRVSRGFAFVNMVTSDDANRCIKHLNQSVLEGRYITVERVFWLYSEDIASAMLAEIKDDQSIHRNKLKQLNSIYIAPTTLQPQRILNSQLIKRTSANTQLPINQAFLSTLKSGCCVTAETCKDSHSWSLSWSEKFTG
ncbi:serine/arginine-rich splicing factor SR45a-like isoform X2 [Salvia splendens]|uniref:serine/arginine-rich splicing factor SR45a-like isoform X2 n=1 Tax=Salvia splendens TaxID=180675 RepID=UPI001C26ACB8|nr:serine/arginine-rich splicing factor SR45a-like isoform X2 [Salvia splendens]